ncbi:MAG: phosphoribosylanthranilate isomerase [Thermoguttaceae bacterium]
MFQIKICGITGVEDALAVVRAGADAVGLNFYAGSPRHVTPQEARAILAVLPAEMVKVGVFVDTATEAICQIFDELGLDLIQLHGDQPPELLPRLGGRPVMRAFRIGAAGLDPVVRYLHTCDGLSCRPKFVLFDAYSDTQFGGTGEVIDQMLINEYNIRVDRSSVVLAGGLTPANVAYAIRTVHPAAVDTASGVETSPGKKDQAAVAAFVQAARAAFGEP